MPDMLTQDLFQRDSWDRVGAMLATRLAFCKEHRKNNYDDAFARYEELHRGEDASVKIKADDKDENWRCRVFYRIIRQKVLSARSQIEDAYSVDGNHFPFSLEETPRSESPTQINEQLKEIGIDVKEILDEKKTQIDDHLMVSKSYNELLKSIADAPLYGTGVLMSPQMYKDIARVVDIETMGEMPPVMMGEDGKPTPESMEVIKQYTKQNTSVNIRMEEVDRIAIRRISPTMVYPDPACLGNAQKGFGVFIKQWTSISELHRWSREKNADGSDRYDNKKIKEVMDEYYAQADGRGAYSHVKTNSDIESDISNGNVPVYTFYGHLLRRDVADLINDGPDSNKGLDLESDIDDYEPIEVIADIVEGGRLLRIVENPLPSKRRPIHFFQYEETGEWVGMGIAQKLEGLQIAFNDFIRYWVDNLKLSSHVILGVVSSALDEGEDLSIFPGKRIYLKRDENIRQIIQQLNIQDTSGSFLNGMLRLIDLIDYEAGVPRILSGQASGGQKTAFEIGQLEAHSLKQLGMTIRDIDEAIISAVELIYEHLLVYGEGAESTPGDFRIKASGFNTFQSTRLKLANIQQIIAMAEPSPIGRRTVKIEEAYRELFRVMDKHNRRYLRDDDELEEYDQKEAQNMQAQAQQAMAMTQQQAQAVEMAKAQARISELEAKGQMLEKELLAKAQINEIEMQAKAAEAEKDRRHDTEMKLMDIEGKERFSSAN